MGKKKQKEGEKERYAQLLVGALIYVLLYGL